MIFTFDPHSTQNFTFNPEFDFTYDHKIFTFVAKFSHSTEDWIFDIQVTNGFKQKERFT